MKNIILQYLNAFILNNTRSSKRQPYYNYKIVVKKLGSHVFD